MDDEVKGKGVSANYKYRMNDARIGRFFAVDPLAPEYPHNSPYAFSENVVIDHVELEGLEKSPVHGPETNDQGVSTAAVDGVGTNVPNDTEFINELKHQQFLNNLPEPSYIKEAKPRCILCEQYMEQVQIQMKLNEQMYGGTNPLSQGRSFVIIKNALELAGSEFIGIKAGQLLVRGGRALYLEGKLASMSVETAETTSKILPYVDEYIDYELQGGRVVYHGEVPMITNIGQAPPGGVTIGGKYYRSGQFLPTKKRMYQGRGSLPPLGSITLGNSSLRPEFTNYHLYSQNTKVGIGIGGAGLGI